VKRIIFTIYSYEKGKVIHFCPGTNLRRTLISAISEARDKEHSGEHEGIHLPCLGTSRLSRMTMK
jgi:hypothetical protein